MTFLNRNFEQRKSEGGRFLNYLYLVSHELTRIFHARVHHHHLLFLSKVKVTSSIFFHEF